MSTDRADAGHSSALSAAMRSRSAATLLDGYLDRIHGAQLDHDYVRPLRPPDAGQPRAGCRAARRLSRRGGQLVVSIPQAGPP